jgi:IclR family transcriptional regulator, acetate operon repressor
MRVSNGAREQVQSAARVVQAMEFIARRKEVRAGDVAAELGIHKSNALRLLETFRRFDWVAVDQERRFYRVGPALFAIGEAAAANLHLEEVLHLAEELRDLTGETVHIAVPHIDRMLIVARVESGHALRVSCPIGSRDPLYNSSLGKACLATMPDDEREAILATLTLEPRTPNTITSLDALRADIERTRERGYAIDDGEARLGVRCMGLAATRPGSPRLVALSITGPAERWTLDAITHAAPAILETFRAHALLTADGNR